MMIRIYLISNIHKVYSVRKEFKIPYGFCKFMRESTIECLHNHFFSEINRIKFINGIVGIVLISQSVNQFGLVVLIFNSIKGMETLRRDCNSSKDKQGNKKSFHRNPIQMINLT